MKDKYDVIVIGAGIGGLSAAGMIAKAGKSVLVVDQRPEPGGVCHSFERNGYTFDVGPHLLSGCGQEGVVTNQLKELGVADKVEFLDVNPLSDGHLLLVPRDHYERLSEIPPPIAGELAEAIPRLGKALRAATKAEGYNVLLNEGAVAGQVVPHVHFHLIPRKSGDGLGYRWNAGAYQTGHAEKIAAAYKKAMPDI